MPQASASTVWWCVLNRVSCMCRLVLVPPEGNLSRERHIAAIGGAAMMTHEAGHVFKQLSQHTTCP